MGSCASIPNDTKTLFPWLNDADSLKRYLKYVDLEKIKKKFLDENVIDTQGFLTTGVGPFNVFASIVSGNTPNNVDQSLLGSHIKDFMVCHNRPINDEKWNDPTFLAASMAGPDASGPGHVFITTKHLHFDTFNILPIVMNKNIQFLNNLLLAALEYTKNRGWKNPGFYFHCYPYNSVQSLHLHVVNKDNLGPSFYRQKHKNLSMYDVLSMDTF